MFWICISVRELIKFSCLFLWDSTLVLLYVKYFIVHGPESVVANSQSYTIISANSNAISAFQKIVSLSNISSNIVYLNFSNFCSSLPFQIGNLFMNESLRYQSNTDNSTNSCSWIAHQISFNDKCLIVLNLPTF